MRKVPNGKESLITGLQCPRCGRTNSQISTRSHVCQPCRGEGVPVNLSTVYDLEALRGRWSVEMLQKRDPGLWRFEELLPVPREFAVSLGEGETPLVFCPTWTKRLGVGALFAKDESQNPTWSFKDRAAAMAASHARMVGAPVLTAASTGNAGSATAAYGRKAGLPTVIFVSRDVDSLMAAHMRVYGAALVAVPTKRDRWRMMTLCVKEWGWYPNSNFHDPAVGNNPFAVDGYKTIAYEIWLQLGGRAPDWIVVPTGYGDGLFGIFKGFVELTHLGLCRQVPKMVAAEIHGSLGEALRRGGDRVESVEGDAHTVAFSISPKASTFQALKAVRSSGGKAIRVGDEEVLVAQERIAREEGMFVETASAAAFAAALRLAAEIDGGLKPEDVMVVIQTSCGLKSVNVVGGGQHPPFAVLEPLTLETLRKLLRDQEGWPL